MITINELSLNNLKIVALETELQFSNGRVVIEFSADEALDFLRATDDSKFLMFSFKGDISNLKDELKFIKFPTKTNGDVLIIRGNDDTGICDIMTIQNHFSALTERTEWNPLLGFVMVDGCEGFGVNYITKLVQ